MAALLLAAGGDLSVGGKVAAGLSLADKGNAKENLAEVAATKQPLVSFCIALVNIILSTLNTKGRGLQHSTNQSFTDASSLRMASRARTNCKLQQALLHLTNAFERQCTN